MYNFALNQLMTLNLNFVAIIGVLVGLLLGLKIENKNNVILWLLGALFISYLMGPTPYYEAIPFSHIFFSGIVGILIGSGIKGISGR
uniref:Energy-converting hydrogenase B subunit J n=1 Tax=Methanococcus maripaludis (strain C6 / ATCC BAA-1332) TaxID=444158 RepID=A9A937_METM6